ncbi:MAG: acyltransferase family protein [Microcoleaceae cyanobacterium]
MKEKQRLTGIDLFRGLATYGVVILHVDANIRVYPPGWEQIRLLFAFAVPFFLATSFYLATSKLYTSSQPYQLRPRLSRLLIPYLFWTFFYLLYKVVKYSLNRELDQLQAVFQDPVAILFFGGAAFHLYFLPLIATGTLLLKVSEYLIYRKVKLTLLVCFFILSLAIYQLISATGNSFQYDQNVAFESLTDLISPSGNLVNNPLVRIVLVALSWIIRCLPYIFAAMILNHPSNKVNFSSAKSDHIVIALLVFLGVNLWGVTLFPAAIVEILQGYSALLLALLISRDLQEHPILKSLGLCSFGIYLLHLVFVEGFQIICQRVYPSYTTHISTLFLLLIAMVIFIMSWSVTSFLVQKKLISKLIFGT